MRALGVVVVLEDGQTLPGRLQRSRHLPLPIFPLQRSVQAFDKRVQIGPMGWIDDGLDA